MAKKTKVAGFRANSGLTTSKQGFRNNSTPREQIKVDLVSPDGKSFGTVSFDAYEAIEGGTLDSYKPKNEKEAEALNSFRKHPGIPVSADGIDFGYISYDAHRMLTGDDFNGFDGYEPHSETEKETIDAFTPYLENKARESRVNSNPVFARYNIDPADFGMKELMSWAEEHNHNVTIDSNFKTHITPVYEGGLFGTGLFGNKKSTDQEDEDAEALLLLMENNARAEVAGTDGGALGAAVVSFGDGLTFGGMSATA
ncbi:MAG: hypothetical protein J6V06_02690, partial [Clostridia bacterium]|nr:hypothetical protein [Clostridia bacterium]